MSRSFSQDIVYRLDRREIHPVMEYGVFVLVRRLAKIGSLVLYIPVSSFRERVDGTSSSCIVSHIVLSSCSSAREIKIIHSEAGKTTLAELLE